MTGVSLWEVATCSPLTWPPSLTASSPMTAQCPPRPPSSVLAGCPPEQGLSPLLHVRGRDLSARPWEQASPFSSGLFLTRLCYFRAGSARWLCGRHSTESTPRRSRASSRWEACHTRVEDSL